MRIAFLCTANVARSIMAESIMRSILEKRGRTDIEVFSAGVKDYTDIEPIDKVVTVCEKNGTPICKSGATFMDNVDLESMDWILAMQFAHIAKLRKEKNLPPKVKVALLGQFSPNSEDHHEIMDPMGKRLAVFDKCYRQIDQCIRTFLETEGRECEKSDEESKDANGGEILTFEEWAKIDEEADPTFEVIDVTSARANRTFRELAENA